MDCCVTAIVFGKLGDSYEYLVFNAHINLISKVGIFYTIVNQKKIALRFLLVDIES